MIRPIQIQPVLNGYICHVGCQNVVFNTVEDVLNNLRRYLLNPDETEKNFRENSVNSRLLEEPCVPPPGRIMESQDGGTGMGASVTTGNPVLRR